MSKDVKVHGWVQMNGDLELVLNCALRYAIGRRTYVPDTVISYIRYLLPRLSHKTLVVMRNDIADEIKLQKRIGKELYMQDEWLKLAEDISKEIEKKAVQNETDTSN